jgi:hypothetical protein
MLMPTGSRGASGTGARADLQRYGRIQKKYGNKFIITGGFGHEGRDALRTCPEEVFKQVSATPSTK